MSDVVERLREEEEWFESDHALYQTLHDAISEIEWLRQEVECLRQEVETWSKDHAAGVLRRRKLDAENARLCEALEKIRKLAYTLDAPMGDEARMDMAVNIATRALEGNEE